MNTTLLSKNIQVVN